MGGGNGAKAAQKRERNAKDAKKDPQSQLKSVRIQLSFVRFDLSSLLFGLRVLWFYIGATDFFVAIGLPVVLLSWRVMEHGSFWLTPTINLARLLSSFVAISCPFRASVVGFHVQIDGILLLEDCGPGNPNM
jgi:hypothetical protein